MSTIESNKIVERTIKIEVFNFCKEYGYKNSEKITLNKQEGKRGKILYPTQQTLKLSKEQRNFLLQFINSL
jgi:hypothetical protein